MFRLVKFQSLIFNLNFQCVVWYGFDITYIHIYTYIHIFDKQYTEKKSYNQISYILPRETKKTSEKIAVTPFRFFSAILTISIVNFLYYYCCSIKWISRISYPSHLEKDVWSSWVFQRPSDFSILNHSISNSDTYKK